MKSVNGILLISLSLFVLWIGVTGRFPKLMQAIGILRDTREPTNPAGNALLQTSHTPTNAPVSTASQFDKAAFDKALAFSGAA